MKKVHPLLQILVAFLLADIMGGMIHWAEDSYLDYWVDLPILDSIARDNELHHYFPRSLLSYSYLEHMTYTLPIVTLFLFVVYLLYPKLFFLYPYFVVTFFVFSACINIIHRFSHLRDCETNPFLKQLQKWGIFCSHEHHSIHHIKVDQKYCGIFEYNNYLLDALHFWRGLEYMVFLLTGLIPTRKIRYEDYAEIHTHLHENAKLKCPDLPTREEVKELEEILKQYKKCKQKDPSKDSSNDSAKALAKDTTQDYLIRLA
jgi:hypothetical protein